jgi:hypothetical protein
MVDDMLAHLGPMLASERVPCEQGRSAAALGT